MAVMRGRLPMGDPFMVQSQATLESCTLGVSGKNHYMQGGEARAGLNLRSLRQF